MPSGVQVLAIDKKTNFLKLRVETGSDLWRLSHLVLPGDSLGAFTHRRDPEAPSDTPEAQKERRPVFLSVRVEKIEFHEFSGHLRITGPITEGPFDIGRHHTLDLEEGAVVSLTKPELRAADWALLEEGQKGKHEPRLLVVCLDWSEGAIVRIRGRSMEVVVENTRRGTGKYVKSGGAKREKEDTQYLEGIATILEKEVAEAQGLVISGPGFCKESLAKLWRSRKRPGPPPVVESTSEAALIGVNELLRSGKAEQALSGSLSAEEAREVERLVSLLGTPNMTAVGAAGVQTVAGSGAVELLLALDNRLREPAIGKCLDSVRSSGGRILIVRHEGEPGRRLQALGGVAAILRYALRSA